jgi:hypothetical protein
VDPVTRHVENLTIHCRPYLHEAIGGGQSASEARIFPCLIRCSLALARPAGARSHGHGTRLAPFYRLACLTRKAIWNSVCSGRLRNARRARVAARTAGEGEAAPMLPVRAPVPVTTTTSRSHDEHVVRQSSHLASKSEISFDTCLPLLFLSPPSTLFGKDERRKMLRAGCCMYNAPDTSS